MDPMSFRTEMQAPQAARRRFHQSMAAYSETVGNTTATQMEFPATCRRISQAQRRSTDGDNLNGWCNLHDGGCQHLGKSING